MPADATKGKATLIKWLFVFFNVFSLMPHAPLLIEIRSGTTKFIEA